MTRLPAVVHRLALVAIALSWTTACAEIVGGDTRGVSVDVGYLGEVAPGTRQWLSWLQANEHCAEFGKKPRLVDLRGRVAIYRCVEGE